MIKTKIIRIADISIDGDTQQREKIDQIVVGEYAEAMRCGAKFPPVTLFHDGAQYWLADGFHRFHACKQAEILEIQAEIYDGICRDAILFSAGANNIHGLRPSNADKRKSILVLLNDTEWMQWSDRQIAKHCHTGHPLVAKYRAELSGRNSIVSLSEPKNNELETRKFTTSTGKTAERVINTPIPEEPHEFDDCAPSSEEIEASIKAEADQIEYIKNVLAQDEPLAQALADVKQYKESARIAKERLDGIMNEKNELIRMVKSLQARLKKAGIK